MHIYIFTRTRTYFEKPTIKFVKYYQIYPTPSSLWSPLQVTSLRLPPDPKKLSLRGKEDQTAVAATTWEHRQARVLWRFWVRKLHGESKGLLSYGVGIGRLPCRFPRKMLNRTKSLLKRNHSQRFQTVTATCCFPGVGVWCILNERGVVPVSFFRMWMWMLGQ